MPQLNENFLKLEKNYLFINIAKKIAAFKEKNPSADIIRMGIGDVTLPIAPVVIESDADIFSSNRVCSFHRVFVQRVVAPYIKFVALLQF